VRLGAVGGALSGDGRFHVLRQQQPAGQRPTAGGARLPPPPLTKWCGAPREWLEVSRLAGAVPPWMTTLKVNSHCRFSLACPHFWPTVPHPVVSWERPSDEIARVRVVSPIHRAVIDESVPSKTRWRDRICSSGTVLQLCNSIWQSSAVPPMLARPAGLTRSHCRVAQLIVAVKARGLGTDGALQWTMASKREHGSSVASAAKRSKMEESSVNPRRYRTVKEGVYGKGPVVHCERSRACEAKELTSPAQG
jgi:hypothetical protein